MAVTSQRPLQPSREIGSQEVSSKPTVPMVDVETNAAKGLVFGALPPICKASAVSPVEIRLDKKTIEAVSEAVADVRVQHSELHGITIPADRAASMIDEYPILSVAAASATGTTQMLGVAELRVKETDRLKVMADGLISCGVTVDYDDNSMRVTNSVVSGGATLSAQHDHRIAMSFLTLGLIAEAPITVTGCSTIETSFPGFATGMNQLGAFIADSDAI